jgi:hypothetical protein
MGSRAQELKDDIHRLNKDIRSLHWNIAFYITDLDIAAAGYRVFTCRHNDLPHTIDDAKTTREKTADVVANDFFRDYADDVDFIEAYQDARGSLLDHHRAHERHDPGRGERAGILKTELYHVDQRRGVVPTYHSGFVIWYRTQVQVVICGYPSSTSWRSAHECEESGFTRRVRRVSGCFHERNIRSKN